MPEELHREQWRKRSRFVVSCFELCWVTVLALAGASSDRNCSLQIVDYRTVERTWSRDSERRVMADSRLIQ